jgi:hypothetical protein
MQTLPGPNERADVWRCSGVRCTRVIEGHHLVIIGKDERRPRPVQHNDDGVDEPQHPGTASGAGMATPRLQAGFHSFTSAPSMSLCYSSIEWGAPGFPAV